MGTLISNPPICSGSAHACAAGAPSWRNPTPTPGDCAPSAMNARSTAGVRGAGWGDIRYASTTGCPPGPPSMSTTAAAHRGPGCATFRTVSSQPLFPATPPANMLLDSPPPDPGIGQLAMFSEVTQAWDGTGPGTGGAGPDGLAVTPPGRRAAACCCDDEMDVAAMTPASASTPPATTYRRHRGRARSALAVPMTSGSGPSSGCKGNIPHHLRRF